MNKDWNQNIYELRFNISVALRTAHYQTPDVPCSVMGYRDRTTKRWMLKYGLPLLHGEGGSHLEPTAWMPKPTIGKRR